MTAGATIDAIWIYPVKALDGVSVPEARITPGGSLEFDRRWAIVNKAGGFFNGKRSRVVHEIRCRFDLSQHRVRLEREGRSFEGPIDLSAPWLSRELGEPVRIEENARSGFPDDTEAPGPTIISRATLAETGAWFGIGAEEMRARLRPNLVIEGLPPFGEDRLFAHEGTRIRFLAGCIEIEGINPCQRCVVPSRDPATGNVFPGFQKTFATRRAETLPPWTHRDRFDHYYRVSVNTAIGPGEAGKWLRVGDPVRCGE